MAASVQSTLKKIPLMAGRGARLFLLGTPVVAGGITAIEGPTLSARNFEAPPGLPAALRRARSAGKPCAADSASWGCTSVAGLEEEND
jgi:hypothetical protein